MAEKQKGRVSIAKAKATSVIAHRSGFRFLYIFWLRSSHEIFCVIQTPINFVTHVVTPSQSIQLL